MKFKSIAGNIINVFDAYSAQDLESKLEQYYIGTLSIYLFKEWFNVDVARSDAIQYIFWLADTFGNVIKNPRVIVKQKSRAKLRRIK